MNVYSETIKARCDGSLCAVLGQLAPDSFFEEEVAFGQEPAV